MPDHASHTDALDRPLLIAHRGYSAIAPENTLASYRAAIEAGAPAAECDVVGTKDGVVILSHDWTADRCTDGTGPFAEMPLEQVKKLDAGSWKGEQFKGEPVPTLKETLALTRGRLRLVVEIKDAGVVAQVAADIREMDALCDCTIISFNLEACRQMREIEPALPVGWLTGGIRRSAGEGEGAACRGGEEEEEALADDLIARALSANVQFIDVAATGTPPVLIRRARLSGLSVWVWTVNDPDQYAHFTTLGVNGITTDEVKVGG